MLYELMILILYVFIKLACYTGWCYFAFSYLGFPVFRKKTLASILGVLRLGMGVIIGTILIVTFVQTIYDIFNSKYLAYFLLYPVVRVFEWGAILILLELIYRKKQKSSNKHTPVRIMIWITGGVVISCLADIPVLLESGGIPIGRIFC